MHLSRLSFLLAIAGVVLADAGLDPPGLQPLITQGDRLLAQGQFTEAARAYSDAIELSPGQYLLYYKRATAYFSANRHSNALEDFDTVISLTNESGATFDKAFLMKGKIFAREGNWNEARDALKSYTTKVKADRTAGDLLFGISEGEVASKKAVAAQSASDWPQCVEQSTAALHTATHSVTLRQMRADCALAAGDVEQAAADLTRLTHLAPPSTAFFTRLASLTYFILPPSQQAQSTLKQCLHGDPDSKVCAAAHRQLKQLDKQFTKLQTLLDAGTWGAIIKLVAGDDGLAAKFDDALKKALDPLALPPAVEPLRTSAKRRTIYSAACRAFVESGQVRKSESWCEELLRMDPEAIEGLVGRGELALIQEDWEEAVRAFDKAWKAGGQQGGELHQKLQKAQRLLKQSKAKDYYKVLGVSRDADAKTIKKAYRKAAMTAHPDKGGSEAKMAAVNEAYEVLSKPELRQRFDNGEDPMDPTSQQGGPFHQGGGNPFMFFQQGGGPFGHHGGGGHTFHYQWGG